MDTKTPPAAPVTSVTSATSPSTYRGLSADLARPDFGSSEDELAALTSGCGLFDRSFCDRLALSGEDRARFLNGQVTCAVKDLAPGTGTFGFLATLKGRVEVEMTILATEDRLLLDLPPGTADAVEERLAKYVIVDRVEFSRPELRVLTLIGPESDTLVNTLVNTLVAAVGSADDDDGRASGDWHHREVSIAGRSVRWVREPAHAAAAAGTEGVSLWVAPDDVDVVSDALQRAGAVPVGWRAVERLRVENGRPLWGVDFGDDTFPQETGLEGAVNYEKGCYLGQEVIARIHYRGGVQRHMRRLLLDAPAAAGADLELDGKSVGRLGSVARSVSGAGWHGLGVVHQRAAVGAKVSVLEDGEPVATAKVAEL